MSIRPRSRERSAALMRTAGAPLMHPIRRVAVALAEQGRVVILRKGKPADPRDFKGVYRLTAPRQD